MRWPGVAAVVLGMLLLGAPAAHAAAPATLTGTLKGAKLPAAGKGVVPVYAVRLRDGRVVSGTYASAAGRFKLRTPAGSYALIAALVPFTGSHSPVERVADFVTAKAGKRIALKPTLKKRKARKRKPRAIPLRARAAFVAVDYPAIWVKVFDAPAGELHVLGKGITDMLITDLVPSIGKCDAIVVEREHLDEVIAEIERSNSKYFDPSTRLQRGKLIANNGTVAGAVTVSGDTMTITATYNDQRTGRSKTVSVSGPKDDAFALEERLAPLLTNAICPHTPNTYAGTFSGSWTTTLNSYTVTWSGSAVIQLTTEHGGAPSGWPAGEYAHYTVLRGTVHVELDGTRGSCTAHGETDLTLPAGISSGEDTVQLADKPYYSLNVSTRGDEVVPYNETGTSCQTDAQYPLTGLQFAFTPAPLQSMDGNLTASTTWDQYGMSSHYTSSFSFAPAS
jgi:hypothetical protein